MPKKNILILVCVLAVGAALATFFDNTEKKHEKIGNSLLTTDQALKVSKIEMMENEKKITLTKSQNNQWTVDGEQSFPASAEKIVKFFDAMMKTKIARMVSQRKEKLSDLNLESGATLTLVGSDKPIIQLVLGKKRTGGGQYFRFKDSNTSYMLDTDVTLNLKREEWELKTLVNVPKEKVKSVHYLSKTNNVILERKSKDDTLSPTLQENQDLKSGSTSASESLLSNFTYTSKQKIGSDGIKFQEPVVKLETFSGDKYSVSLASKKEKTANKDGKEETKTTHFIKIAMEHGSTASAKRAELINQLMSQWVFQIEPYQEEKFRKKLEDFVKQKEPGKSKEESLKGKG